MARVFKAGVRKGREGAVAAVRACVEGGWWVPARRHTIEAVAHDKCRCGKAAGTLWHRVGKCGRTEQDSVRTCPEAVLRAGQARV